MSGDVPPRVDGKDPEAVRLGEWLQSKRLAATMNRPELVQSALFYRPDARLSQDYLSKLEYGVRSLTSASIAIREGIRLALDLSPEEWEAETGLRASREIPNALKSLTQERLIARSQVIHRARSSQPESESIFLPDTLREAIDLYGSRYPDLLNPAWQRYLASIRFRDGTPTEPGRWLDVYRDLIRNDVVPGEN